MLQVPREYANDRICFRVDAEAHQNLESFNSPKCILLVYTEQNTYRADVTKDLGVFHSFVDTDVDENRINKKGDFSIVACNTAFDYALTTF